MDDCYYSLNATVNFYSSKIAIPVQNINLNYHSKKPTPKISINYYNWYIFYSNSGAPFDMQGVCKDCLYTYA